MTVFLMLLNVGAAMWNGYAYDQNGSTVNLVVMIVNIVVAALLLGVAVTE